MYRRSRGKMCSVGEIGWRCFFFFALFATVTVIAQPLPPCPPLPHPERVDARAVLAHPAVRHALVQVDRAREGDRATAHGAADGAAPLQSAVQYETCGAHNHPTKASATSTVTSHLADQQLALARTPSADLLWTE